MIKQTLLGTLSFLVLITFQQARSANAEFPASGKPLAQVSVSAGKTVPDFVPGRLLVKFKPGVNPKGEQAVLAAKNARRVGSIPQIGVRIIELPENANEKAHLAVFRGRREVEFAELDQVCVPALVPNDPWYNHHITPEWHLPRIGAPAAWDITTGRNDVIIAILDTGIDNSHPELTAKMVSGWNVRNGNSDTSDINGHGTRVAGTASAISNNNTLIASVAWGCKIMPIVVTDMYGYSSSTFLANGLIWSADHGAQVANMSLSMLHSSTLTSAAQYFQDKGGVVIMSAGNSPIFDPQPDNPYILTISATDLDDQVASWSTTGNCIDLGAPGVRIITIQHFDHSIVGSSSGTSHSAPIVAGVAALVISANPNLTGQEVQEIIKQSADDLGSAGWDPGYGWGRVNAAQAVNLALNYGGGGGSDTEPPSVSFISPTHGDTVSGGISVGVSATDNVGVASVSLSVDGILLANDNAAPYTFYWDTTEAADGLHILTATAMDDAGNSSSTDITVDVNNPVPDTTPPSISITSPSEGETVSGTVIIQANASDNVGVVAVTFSVDGLSIGSDAFAPYSIVWDTTSETNGSHILTATAGDAAGNTTDAQVMVTVSNIVPDTTPPTVNITSPASGSTVSGTISVQVSASDNISVSWVSLSVDGTTLDTDTTYPYVFIWNTDTASDGPCTLTATAADGAGNTADDPIEVMVDNSDDTTPPTISITSPKDGERVKRPGFVRVNATDNVAVVEVELYVDGMLTNYSTTAPFNLKWNPKKLSRGNHVLECRAYDAAGNSGVSPTVTVIR
ncbi:MAG: Ig-like domain-containing protein [Planctomycetota bacterium]|jgi:subtilisin family serine protease